VAPVAERVTLAVSVTLAGDVTDVGDAVRVVAVKALFSRTSSAEDCEVE
jgi:hypothetical protein